MIFATSNSFFKVWKIEQRDKDCIVQMSTSRKDRRTDEYLNSNWSFVSFVGKANEKIREMEKGDRLTNVQLGLSWEPYEKDGERIYAKSPRMVIFDFDKVDAPKKNVNIEDNNEFEELAGEDELPF